MLKNLLNLIKVVEFLLSNTQVFGYFNVTNEHATPHCWEAQTSAIVKLHPSRVILIEFSPVEAIDADKLEQQKSSLVLRNPKDS